MWQFTKKIRIISKAVFTESKSLTFTWCLQISVILPPRCVTLNRVESKREPNFWTMSHCWVFLKVGSFSKLDVNFSTERVLPGVASIPLEHRLYAKKSAGLSLFWICCVYWCLLMATDVTWRGQGQSKVGSMVSCLGSWSGPQVSWGACWGRGYQWGLMHHG